MRHLTLQITFRGETHTFGTTVGDTEYFHCGDWVECNVPDVSADDHEKIGMITGFDTSELFVYAYIEGQCVSDVVNVDVFGEDLNNDNVFSWAFLIDGVPATFHEIDSILNNTRSNHGQA